MSILLNFKRPSLIILFIGFVTWGFSQNPHVTKQNYLDGKMSTEQYIEYLEGVVSLSDMSVEDKARMYVEQRQEANAQIDILPIIIDAFKWLSNMGFKDAITHLLSPDCHKNRKAIHNFGVDKLNELMSDQNLATRYQYWK